ncbi:MAG: VWA domain-containing protein [Candidatus Polarisedimenticolia bacterium]
MRLLPRETPAPVQVMIPGLPVLRRAILAGGFATAAIALAFSQSPPTRVDVRLILLDTVVTDKKGSPITGLRLEDFDLLVDNVRVPIHSLEEKCAGAGGAGAPSDTPPEPRQFVLVFDFSHLMVVSRRDAIQAAERFVSDGMAPGDSVMVLALMRGLYVVNGFTSDRAFLRDKLAALREDRSMTDTLALTEENTIERLIIESGRRSQAGAFMMRGPRSSGGLGALELECKSEARISEREVASSLALLAGAMPALAGLPGRKAMILFTETLRDDPGLPYYEACGIGMLGRPSTMLTVQPELDDLVRKANLAGVSFYPVHAGGMGSVATSPSRHSAGGLQAHVALATGGSNSILMKDQQVSFRQAAQDMSCHYVVAFRPDEAMRSGDHVVSLTVRRSGVKVRHRQSFTLQTPEEASESEILAALATPGLKRDLKIEAHGYGMGEGRRGKRRVLLKASVRASDLMVVRAVRSDRAGLVQIRGGIISNSELQCSFTRSIPFEDPPGAAASRRIGVETVCEVPEGEHEIVVAARDEMAGSMGTFWGKLRVGSPRREGRIFLWGGPGLDLWQGDADTDLFVRPAGTIREGEKGRLTWIACIDGAGARSRPSPAPSGSTLLEGPIRLRLDARPVYVEETAGCRAMGVDIRAGALPPGRYHVRPEVQPPWKAAGQPAEIEVTPARGSPGRRDP